MSEVSRQSQSCCRASTTRAHPARRRRVRGGRRGRADPRWAQDGPEVARALVDVSDATAVVTRFLTIGLPILLVVVALTTWFTVGRALAPAEAIRREVDGISAAQLHRRVPQPQAADEIGRLAATMNRMLARLEDSRNSQRRFVSDASHELRSPLTTIVSIPRLLWRIRTGPPPRSLRTWCWPKN